MIMKILSFVFDNISTFISIIALFLSIYALYTNRKGVEVFFDQSYIFYPPRSLAFLDIQNNINEYVTEAAGLNLKVEIVNTSPCDIAYFDLRAFDPDTNKNYFLVTHASIGERNSDGSVYIIDGGNLYKHVIPNAENGILKSHDFYKWNLYIIPRPESTKLRVSFRVAVKKRLMLKKDPFATPNQKYFKYFTKNFDITNWNPSYTWRMDQIRHASERCDNSPQPESSPPEKESPPALCKID